LFGLIVMILSDRYVLSNRFEIYCGNKTRGPESAPPLANNVSGAAAVYRNLQAVFVPDEEFGRAEKKRFIVCDREYTSLTLVQTLLQQGFYCIGTCCPSRLGFPMTIAWPPKTRVQRGAYTMARLKTNPDIQALAWRDSGNVYFLASGASSEPRTVLRRSKRGPESMEVPCPAFVDVYNQRMNGADVHDQMRLQQYPLQGTIRFRKYYKSIALGLIDIIVNMFIIHTTTAKKNGRTPLTHGQFRSLLSQQLCELSMDDLLTDANDYGIEGPDDDGSSNDGDDILDELQGAPLYVPSTEHILLTTLERKPDGKLNGKSCTVCSYLRSAERIERTRQTVTYCKQCTANHVNHQCVFLCTKPRFLLGGLSCSEFYHNVWKCKKPAKTKTK
jgi:hypothetical protein